MTISALLSASLSPCKTWAAFALLLCVVSGLLFATVTQIGSAAAVELFQRVVAIDPDYAPACQNLAAVTKSVIAP